MVLDIIIVTILYLFVILFPFLILALLFSGKKGMKEFFEFLKAFPAGFLFIVAWGLFWMIPIMLIFIILDLLFWQEIFYEFDLIIRVVLSLLCLFLFVAWYSLGYKRLPIKKD